MMGRSREDVTLAAIRELCSTYLNLRFYLADIDSSRDLIDSSMQAIENQIAHLLKDLPVASRAGVVQQISETLSLRLYKLMPAGPEAAPFIQPMRYIQPIIEQSFDLFKTAIDMGLSPEGGVNDDADRVFEMLMQHCLNPESGHWRAITTTFLHRWNGTLIHSLRFAREGMRSWRKNIADPQSEISVKTLSLFLKGIIQSQVDDNPELAQEVLRLAAQGSCSFDVAALLIAGVPPPKAGETDRITQGPKVKGILRKASSNHGLFSLVTQNGPLDAYIARGGLIRTK